MKKLIALIACCTLQPMVAMQEYDPIQSSDDDNESSITLPHLNCIDPIEDGSASELGSPVPHRMAQPVNRRSLAQKIRRYPVKQSLILQLADSYRDSTKSAELKKCLDLYQRAKKLSFFADDRPQDEIDLDIALLMRALNGNSAQRTGRRKRSLTFTSRHTNN